MNIRSIFLTALCSLLGAQAFAHALWIETTGNGRKGQKQLVEIFWGEYAEHKPDSVGKWFADTREFRLFLIKPDGSREQLKSAAGTDRYTAEFTPDKDGLYLLTISHDAKEAESDTKLQFNAVAAVTVGAVSGTADRAIDQDLRLKGPFGIKHTVQGQAALNYQLNNTAGDQVSVEVFSPSGWNRTIHADARGAVSIPLPWKGRYMAEGSHFNEAEPGELKGSAYKSVWRCVTYTFDVG